jgi:hypothetical protein
MTTAKDVGSIILLVLVSPLALIVLLVGALFASVLVPMLVALLVISAAKIWRQG